MNNFYYFNPTRIIFGKGTISRIAQEIPPHSRVLMISGGGSIRANNVREQVAAALQDFSASEFGGMLLESFRKP